MGINRSDYVMFGLWINKREIEELEKRDPDWLESTEIGKYCHKDGFQGFNLIYDGMSKDYLVFGYIIEEVDESEGLSFHSYNLDSLEDWYDVDAESLVSTFNRLFSLSFKLEDCNLMIFTHWH
jgi:hypothetical protein